MRIYRLLLSMMAVTVGLMSHGNAFAANEANRLELQQEITVVEGTTEVVLPILLVNEAQMTGFQCDLYLPEGFTVATDGYGDYLIDMARTTAKRHSLAAREMESGALRIVLSSMTNATFSGNSGVVLNVTLGIASSVKAGSYTVSLKNNVLTDPQAVRYTSSDVSGTIVVKNMMRGDVNGDGRVDVSDYIGVANRILNIEQAGFNEQAGDVNEDGAIDVSDYLGIGNIIHTGSPFGNSASRGVKQAPTDLSAMDNVIYVAPASAAVGETTATLSLCMKNSAEIRGFQFDMYLPEGVTVSVSSKGKIQGVKLSESRLPEDDEHTLTCSVQQDGAIRFLCGSQYQETFTGNDGEIITMQVNISETVQEGEYPIILKQMKLSESDITKSYETEYIEGTLAIGTTGISSIEGGRQSKAAAIYSLSGQRLEKPVKGINIIGGQKVVIK